MPQYIVAVEHGEDNTGTIITNGYFQTETHAIVDSMEHFTDPDALEELGDGAAPKEIVGMAKSILQGILTDTDFEVVAYPIMQGPNGEHLRYTADEVVGSEEVSSEE